MKKLQGMKKNFSSLENKVMNDLASINGGRAQTNIRTTSPTGANGNSGNTGDTAVCNDDRLVATITVD